MATHREEAEFGSAIDEVWAVVGDFGGFATALGAPEPELQGEGIGQTRSIAMGPEPTVERLEERDADAKKLVYSIVSGPLPVSKYVSTMQLSPAGDGRTKLAWSCEFEPASGATEGDVANVIKMIYQGGIGAMTSRFGS